MIPPFQMRPFIRWNVVAPSKERTEVAKKAWHEGDRLDGRFHLRPGDRGGWTDAPDR